MRATKSGEATADDRDPRWRRRPAELARQGKGWTPCERQSARKGACGAEDLPARTAGLLASRLRAGLRFDAREILQGYAEVLRAGVAGER